MSSRITSNILTTNYLRNMKRNLNNMKSLQNQLASGKTIQKASENPYIASRSMQINAEISYNKQYSENIKDTSNWLDTTDTALSQMGNVFGRIETLLVSAGNAAYGPDERTAVQDEIKEKVNELSQILNTSFDGSYIFGGTKTDSKPTVVVNGILQYADQAAKPIEITAYKDSTGKISNVKSSSLNAAEGTVASLLGANPTLTSDLNAELIATGTSEERKADINRLLAGANAYYNGAVAGPISAAQLTSEKYASNLNVSTVLTDTQKTALIAERNTTTSQDRKEDITKILQGASNIYYNDPASVLSGTLPTSLDTTKITSERYENKKITLDATDVKSLQKELDGKLNSAALADITRVDDINSILYNNTGTLPSSSPSLSLATIKNYEIKVKNGTASTTEIHALNGASKFIYLNQINTELHVDISQGISSVYNQTAIDVMEFIDKNGKAINVSELLNNIINDLATDGDVKSLTTTHLKDIQAVTSNLLKKRSEVGTFQNRMDSAQQNNETQNYDMTDILSKTEDIDFAEITMNYSMMQTVYTASLQTSAKILPMTILSYL